MRALTERQRLLLSFIEDHLRTLGYPPSIREMADHMGIRSTNGVNDHLKALEKKGYITREASLKSRAISLTSHCDHSARNESKPLISVPILGQVVAGEPIWSAEHHQGQLELDRSLLATQSDVFALRIRGDSMVEKGIFEGDLVFVQQTPTARPGQVVVALIDEEATVKTYRPQKDQIVFEPANPRYEPIVVKRSEFKQTNILGVVVGVFRSL